MLDTRKSFDSGERVRPDHQEFTDGVKLAAIAAVSAVLTATVVIGAGKALLPTPEAASVAPVLTQVIERRP